MSVKPLLAPGAEKLVRPARDGDIRPVRVLLVEDNPSDVELTREGLSRSRLIIDMAVVDDGEKAVKYLKNEPPYQKEARPDLVLLDLNLPKKDGCEVLRAIKEDKALKSIPVVILTSSEAESDVARCYVSGANCYVTKPVALESFMRVINSIENFWFAIVKVPSGRPGKNGEKNRALYPELSSEELRSRDKTHGE